LKIIVSIVVDQKSLALRWSLVLDVFVTGDRNETVLEDVIGVASFLNAFFDNLRIISGVFSNCNLVIVVDNDLLIHVNE